jgi:signal transduction histidine kinase
MRLRSIAAKIILAQTALLAVALAVSAAAALAFMNRYLQDSARVSVRDTARMVDNIIGRDTRQAALFSRLIAEDYQVKVALAGVRRGKPYDEQSLRSHLSAELSSLSADFLSLATADGVVFVHEDRVSVERADRAVLDSEPLFLSPAFQECEATQRQAVGVEPVYPRTMAVVAMSPVMGEDGRLLGFVRLGYRLDQRFVSEVRNITDTHVAVRRRGVFIAATLPALQGVAPAPESLRRDYFTHESPIRNGSRDAAELVTASPRAPVRAVMRKTGLVVLCVGFSVFALSVLGGARMARVLVRPLGRLMHGVRRLESGDLDTSIPPAGDDEIGRLSQSFNTMTESLRARDEEIRSSRDQLIESGKLAAVGELAAGVAHEIGNPLAAISGYIQLLNQMSGDGKTVHYLKEMEKEVGFIDAIIRELLDFSRPSRTEDQRVSLNGIVEEALRMLSFHKAMRGVRVSSEPDSLNPEVMGSRKELLQAVLNLALNAAQAVNSDGEVRLRVSSGSGDIPEGRAAIFISDTGPGVPPEQVGKIFDPFYTTRRGGTGLGLSITFRIVQRHGGEITVLQQGGPGAVFRILLPLADSPAGD